ncbi:MAG TPA: acetyl-CoA carboxylase biotin carboxylase subunit [Methylocystis sp.]|jgi:3-methylcrotonyl-CoA carboxylase alpha subunit
MFERLLIANRGEIACRVIRTAKRLGITTVAVYSEADAGALHVDLADEAWLIGPAPARESYLSIDKIVEIARRSGAQAVHPGYGFLSENAQFSECCARAGLIFVGPPASAMRLMGSKASAKALMERAGVPVAPGYHGEATDVATLSEAAAGMGFPVLIKASSGGGGRGMRVVREAGALPEAIAGAKREARASFGDDRLLIEKYLSRARHVEIQIFADAHGGCVSFLERDCSMQRRHQKILEETPAPNLSPEPRREMRQAAVAAARAVGYIGAGTVEFLVQNESFYFLEMNTRLQVEHPVTEMIARQDLVEWQLRVASGERLPLTQDELRMRGCAMEARICAEDPTRDFMPSVGEIAHLRPPRESEAVRVDTGVRNGDRVTHYYDSLLAKLIVWGADRAEALWRLRAALEIFEIVGVSTNLDLLRALVADPKFQRGQYDTGFVESEAARLTMVPTPTRDEEAIILAAGTAAWLADQRRRDEASAAERGDPWSPWAIGDGWRIDGTGHRDIEFNLHARRLRARIYPLAAGGFRLETPAFTAIVEAREHDGRMRLRVDGVAREVGIVRRGGEIVVILSGRNSALTPVDPLRPPARAADLDQQLRAPLPARVTRIFVAQGEKVKKGAPLINLEVMKMEVALTAPRDGQIESILCAEGEWMAEGAKLAALVEEKAA